jgi:hypothetical protein
MATVQDGDDLVTFRNVTVISSTATALFCGIGGRSVWLPRRHVSGRLWCMGDRGTLRVRRWVARDRRLLRAPRTAAVPTVGSAMPWRRLVTPLHLVRADGGAYRAD